MNKDLSMTEKYTLLMLYGGGARTDFMACQFTAGIVLGGLWELTQRQDFSIGGDHKLLVPDSAGEAMVGFSTLYGNLGRQPARSMQSWLSYYCFQPTYKNVRPVVDDVLGALAEKGFLRITWRPGFFRKKRIVEINAEQADVVVEEFIAAVQSNQDRDEIIFCTEMLLLADVFKSYFPMGKRLRIKSTLERYKHAELWRTMEPYANAVRNFNYQNAVYTGATQ